MRGSARLALAFAIATSAWGLACSGSGPAASSATDADGCSVLAHIVGPEDLEVDTRFQRLLVSSQDRRHSGRGGAIYSAPLASAAHDRPLDAAPRKLSLRGRARCSFHPHGIFLQQRQGKADLLYVLNHHDAGDHSADRSCFPDLSLGRQPGTSVEVFEVHEDHLRFVQRLASPTVLGHGNDLAVDDKDRVYVTVPPSSLLQVAQEIWGGSFSEVVRYCPEGCGTTWSVVATLGGFVNGITFTHGRLIVSTTAGGALYELDPAHGHARQLPAFGAGHDNLTRVPETGQLLLASHPDLRRFLQHAHDAEARSPSEVWLLDLDRKPGRPIFHDEGTTLSGVSVAACAGGDLILGQVFGDSVLRCATSRCPQPEDAP